MYGKGAPGLPGGIRVSGSKNRSAASKAVARGRKRASTGTVWTKGTLGAKLGTSSVRNKGKKSKGLLRAGRVAHGEWQNSGAKYGGIERIGGNTIMRGSVYGRKNNGRKNRWLKKSSDSDQRFVTGEIRASNLTVAANRAMAANRRVKPIRRR